MMDRIISLLRENDGGEPADNSHLARFGWVAIVTLAWMAIYMVVGDLVVPDPPASSSFATNALQEWTKFTFATAAFAIFTASLLGPARRIEVWLDNRYPEHAAEDAADYSVRDDLLASMWFGGLWGFRLAVGYAVISILIAMFSVLNGMAEAGYPITSDEVARLTVLNSFAIATLTTLLAGVALLWLINWSMKDTVDELNTPANNTFQKIVSIGRPVATDGGKSDGA